MHVLYHNRFSKKVLIFLLITPFIQSDLVNNEKYAGKVQSALQTGELFLDTFHKVLYRFWNDCVKNTTSEKNGAVLSQGEPRILHIRPDVLLPFIVCILMFRFYTGGKKKENDNIIEFMEINISENVK